MGCHARWVAIHMYIVRERDGVHGRNTIREREDGYYVR